LLVFVYDKFVFKGSAERVCDQDITFLTKLIF